MNTETTEQFSIGKDAFLPLMLLIVSVLLLFIWQVNGFSEQKTALRATIDRQDQMVKQSLQVQASLQKLLTDLLELAKTDQLAQQIVTKHNIQQQAPSGGL